MEEELVKKGINLIRYTPRSKHTCVFYYFKDELFEILVPFFKAGLENNEYCIWVINPDVFSIEDATAALKSRIQNIELYLDKGQMEIGIYKDYYLNEAGMFSAYEVFKKWEQKEKHGLGLGFRGLRVVGDGSWQSDADWLNAGLYEKEVNEVVADKNIIAICTYQINKLDVERILLLGRSHHLCLVKRMGQWSSLEPSEFKKLGT